MSIPFEHSPDSPDWEHFYDDMRHLYRTIVPFLRKWTHLPDGYEEIYQQALREMQQPDFKAVWTLVTVWGINPE